MRSLRRGVYVHPPLQSPPAAFSNRRFPQILLAWSLGSGRACCAASRARTTRGRGRRRTDSQRTAIGMLRIDLVLVCHLLRKVVRRDCVRELVCKVHALLPRLLNLRTRVGHHAGGAAANRGGQAVEVRDARRVDQLVLRHRQRAAASAMSWGDGSASQRLRRGPRRTRHARLTGTFFCVTTHTLSSPRTPIDVSPHASTALNAYSAQASQAASEDE